MIPLRRMNPPICVLSFFICIATAGTANAQDVAAAEALFNRGLADMKAGRYEVGCGAIAESQRIDPRPGTLFSLATCEEEWGHVATAMTRYGDYLAMYEQLPAARKGAQGRRPSVAADKRTKLAPQVPELKLTMPPGAPQGIVVKRNGVSVAGASLGVSLPIDPGTYVLSTQVPGGPVWERTVSITKGEKLSVALEMTSPPAAPVTASTPASPPPSGTSGRRLAAYILGGSGAASLVVGGVMGGLALGAKATAKGHCGDGIGLKDPSACDQTGLDAVGNARTFALGSTIGLVSGAVLTGAGAVLFFTEPKSPRSSIEAHAPRITRAGVSITPWGAALGAQGSF